MHSQIDLITKREPPEKRRRYAEGGVEEIFSEGAVQLAFAFHLFNQYSELLEVEIHPDGEHGKRFDIQKFLKKRTFELIEPQGSTSYGGLYSDTKRSVLVSLKPGLGDVVAKLENTTIVAECKGGIINTKHSGQVSRLRKGLQEVVGQLMARPLEGEQHFAVVPFSLETAKVAKRLRPRCRQAGIEIVLLNQNGIPCE